MTTAIAERQGRPSTIYGRGRRMLNKVPEVTLYFWLIKVLCTTVGETFADFLSGNIGLGETGTALVMTVVLIAALVWQFRKDRYVPSVYWLSVMLISVVGTLLTDNLVDKLHVSLVTSTIGFSILLAAAFAVWYGYERTLSIHTIFTTRREGFYWLAILFTFALGTAGGDLMSEKLALGYWVAAAIFAGAIALVAFSHFALRVNARAVASLPVLCEYCLPLARVGGLMLAPKKGDISHELQAAGAASRILGGGKPKLHSFALPGEDEDRPDPTRAHRARSRGRARRTGARRHRRPAADAGPARRYSRPCPARAGRLRAARTESGAGRVEPDPSRAP